MCNFNYFAELWSSSSVLYFMQKLL